MQRLELLIRKLFLRFQITIHKELQLLQIKLELILGRRFRSLQNGTIYLRFVMVVFINYFNVFLKRNVFNQAPFFSYTSYANKTFIFIFSAFLVLRQNCFFSSLNFYAKIVSLYALRLSLE